MPWGEIGALLLALLAIFAAGNLWFRLVEGILGRVRGLLSRSKEPPAWHVLPEEEEGGEGR